MIDEEVRAAHVSTQPVYPLARNCSYATTSCKHIGTLGASHSMRLFALEPISPSPDDPAAAQTEVMGYRVSAYEGLS